MLSFPIAISLMMMLASLHAASSTTTKVASKSPNENFGEGNDQTSLICLVLQVRMRTIDGARDHLECDLVSVDGSPAIHGLQIKLPNTLVENHRRFLRRGEWYIRIPGARIEQTNIEGYGPVNASVWVPKDAEIVTIPPEEGDELLQVVEGRRNNRYLREDRALAAKSVRRLMIVRVSTSDVSPTYTTDELQQLFFSLSSYSVVRQYALCSSGWLWFKGYNNTSSAVVDLYINGSAASFTQQSLMAAVLPTLMSHFNVKVITSITDHVAFVFPSGLQGARWYGYGTVRSYRSVFSDKFGGIPNTVMHELGHNLGLNHAGLGLDQYNDLTDIMGYGSFAQFGPSKCFNGFHIWSLGWFTDRTVSVNPFSHTILQLACFADYANTVPGQYVVVNVGPFYLAYNQATGVNVGTEAVKNQVTIVQPGAMYTQRVAAISNTTASFQVANYAGSVGTLIIKVCNTVMLNGIQLATLSIGVNDDACS